jgi:exonuclease VII large subunit
MLDATDMSTPVTRGELREEIAQLETRLETRLDQKLENLETRLDQKLERLDQKFERLDQKFERLDQKFEHLEIRLETRLDLWGGALLERLMTELARHTRASQEAMSTEISVIDEKYADLPARVTRLEATVLAPDRR